MYILYAFIIATIVQIIGYKKPTDKKPNRWQKLKPYLQVGLGIIGLYIQFFVINVKPLIPQAKVERQLVPYPIERKIHDSSPQKLNTKILNDSEIMPKVVIVPGTDNDRPGVVRYNGDTARVSFRLLVLNKGLIKNIYTKIKNFHIKNGQILAADSDNLIYKDTFVLGYGLHLDVNYTNLKKQDTTITTINASYQLLKPIKRVKMPEYIFLVNRDDFNGPSKSLFDLMKKVNIYYK